MIAVSSGEHYPAEVPVVFVCPGLKKHCSSDVSGTSSGCFRLLAAVEAPTEKLVDLKVDLRRVRARPKIQPLVC